MKNVIELAKDNGVSPNDLVKALLSYTTTLPSIAEVAFQANALSADQVLEIFLLQSKECLSFRSACERLSLWSAAVQDAVTAQAQRGHLELGSVLVSHALITPEQFSIYHPGEKPLAASAAPIASTSNVPDVALTNDERRMLCDLLADDAKDKFFAALSSIEQGESASASLEAIHQIVHETKGILRFVGLPDIETTVERAEQITEILSANPAFDATVAQGVVTTFRSYGDAIWNLKKDGTTWPESTISHLLNQLNSKLQNLVPSQKEAA